MCCNKFKFDYLSESTGKKYEIKRHYSTLHERAQRWKQLSRCACTAAELKQHGVEREQLVVVGQRAVSVSCENKVKLVQFFRLRFDKLSVKNKSGYGLIECVS